MGVAYLCHVFKACAYIYTYIQMSLLHVALAKKRALSLYTPPGVP